MKQTKGIFNLLQDKFMGKTNEKLSIVEINYLFNKPINQEFNYILKESLEKNLISPDDAFVQLIPRAKTMDYLIPLAICVRDPNFNPNLYINVKNVGIIHVLGYVHLNIDTNMEIRNSILFLLLFKSSNYNLPIFDKTGGSIKNYIDENEFTTISVKEWIQNQNYNSPILKINILSNDKIAKLMDEESLNNFSIILDNASIGNEKYKNTDMTNAIRSLCSKILVNIPFTNTIILMDNKYLREAVIYLNFDAFKFLIEKGLYPSYLLINKIIISMKMYREKGDYVSMKNLENMLILSISYGSEIDMDQYNIIGSLGKSVLENINREYTHPYWKKICKSSFEGRENNFDKNIPDELKRISLSLNIDPYLGKRGICENINDLTKADKEMIKESAQKRQKIRMVAELGRLSDFTNDKIPNLICRNRELLQNDPTNYIDIGMSYYKDDQGAIWCFTDDMYSTILENGFNPYNRTSLPNSFKNKLTNNIQVLKDLGLDPKSGYATNEVSRIFSHSLDKISENDIISEKNSVMEIYKFKNLAIKNGVSSDIIDTVNKDKFILALSNISVDKDYLDFNLLSNSHILTTTARIVNYKNSIGDNISPFFYALTNNISDF